MASPLQRRLLLTSEVTRRAGDDALHAIRWPPSPTPRPRLLASAALAAGVVCVAWSGVFVRLAAVPGVVAAFYRFGIAAICLAPWCIRRRLAVGPVSRRAVLLASVAGVFFACDNALFNIAVQRSSVAIVTLLANTSPFFVALVVWIALRERLGRAFWLGLLLACIGSAVVLTSAAVGSSGAGTADLSGDVLAIVAAAFFAGYLIITQRARALADTLTLTTAAVASGAIVLLFACLALHAPLTGYRPGSWAALLALGLVSQVGGYLGVTYALGEIDATITSVAFLGQVPVTAVLAAIVLGESLTPLQAVGGVLVLGGIYVVLARTGGPGSGSQVPGKQTSRVSDDDV
jgi:drug/metabolite transporter (DMT)-like permease